MKTNLFDYELPTRLIAQVPAANRADSRLLVYNRKTDSLKHRVFSDIIEYFEPGDLLVLNTSRVIPARIFTMPDERRKGGYEILFVKSLEQGQFKAMVKPGRRFRPNDIHTLPGGRRVEVVSIEQSGLRVLNTLDGADVLPVFREYGEMPLPPYITSRESSPDRYQTVYANLEGSIAAPTAGLHFDNSLLAKIRQRGVEIAEIILHVGLGTFKPVEAEEIENHKMHEEVYFISDKTACAFAKAKKLKKSVWACGTTSVRTLESAIGESGELKTGWSSTRCFIKPGYEFKAIDHLITNFHLPKSTLIMLVSAFCSREKVLELYKEAVSQEYRFFSFGDSMLIL